MNVTSYECSKILTAESNGAKVRGWFIWDWTPTVHLIAQYNNLLYVMIKKYLGQCIIIPNSVLFLIV